MSNDYNVFFSSESNEWATPQSFFDELDKEFHFTLDPCCTHENAKCKRHFTIEEDGLKQSWGGGISIL
jgi:site-specific DNA-methyltransferase (adenine-specific)